MIFAALLLVVGSVNLTGQETGKKLLGIWKFDVEEAPYEYQTGKAIFYSEDKATKVKLAFEYEDIKGSKLKVNGNKVTFEMEVQSENVTVVLKLVKDELIGEAATSEGDIPIVMKKMKKK